MLNAAMMRLCLKRQLRKRKLNIITVGETVSTNRDLYKMGLDGERRPTLLAAIRQSGGRGRGEKTFFSPKGGLYFSLLLPVSGDPDPTSLTVSAALAAAEALSSFGLDPRIKWVNDIYLCGKKTAGILAEGGRGKQGRFAVIGIGVNLATPKGGFPSEIAHVATALDAHTDRKISPVTLCARITDRFLTLFEGFSEHRREILHSYRSLSCLDGKTVTVNDGVSEYNAKVLGINDDFTLSVTTDGGEIRSLISGDVSLRLN